MELKQSQIVNLLFIQGQSKSDLSSKFGVTERTIDESIKKINASKFYNKKEEALIIYDKKVKKYRFNTLLPDVMPLTIFFDYFKDYINDTIIKDDFYETIKEFSDYEKTKGLVVETNTLSDRLKHIIMCKMALIINATLKIDYIGNKNKTETKYIKPYNLINTGYSFYLYATYDEKNKKDIGQKRSFSIKGIQKIEKLTISEDRLYRPIQGGDAWGEIKKDKYVTLSLTGTAANYFKREDMLTKDIYEYISEELDGSLFVKMYYRQDLEVAKLIQQWLPFIKITKNSDAKDNIYKIVNENISKFLE